MPTLRVNDIAPRVQYVADGAQTSFTAPFFFFDAADLAVRVDDEAAAGFTVTGAGAPGGGAVVFAEPPAAGRRVTIWRATARERATEFQEAGAFRAAAINDELDRLVMLAQELDDRLGRALAFPPTSAAGPVALPEPAPGKYLRWSADGAGLESVLPLEASGVAISAFAESLLDDPDAAAARLTLGVPAAVQNGAFSYGLAGGAGDAVALAVSPPIAAYAAGQMFWFKAAAANAGPATLAVSGLEPKPLQAQGAPLAPGHIRAGDLCLVIYDGAAFQLVSPAPGGWQHIETLTANDSPTLDFIKGIGPAFTHYLLVLTSLAPMVDSVALYLRVSEDGMTWKAGAADYVFNRVTQAAVTSGVVPGNNSIGAAQIELHGGLGNVDGGVSGEIRLFSPSNGTQQHFVGELIGGNNAGEYVKNSITGQYIGSTNPITGIRLLMSSGNIASGMATLYGLRR